MISEVKGSGRLPRPDHAHEVDKHSYRAILGPLRFLNLAGWKREGRMCAEMRDLSLGRNKLPDWFLLRAKPLEQAKCLKEIEDVRFAAKLFFDFATRQVPGNRQIRIDCPALGVHSSSTSLR